MIEKVSKSLANIKNQYLILAVITLLAAILRFYKLGTWSFWYDEIFTLRDVADMLNLSILHQQFSRVLIYLAVNLLGTNEFNARLVPALIGLVTIPILFFPTRKIFGPKVALLSAAFLAISPWHIYWSQNTRFYTTLLLFYTLVLYLVYFGFEEDKPWYLVASLILFLFSVQERLFAVFLVPIVAGYLLALKLFPIEKPAGFRIRNVLILAIPTVIIGILGGYQFISDPEKWMQGFGWVNNNPFWILAGITFYIGLAFICMGFVGAIYFLFKKDRAILLFSMAATIPILALLILSFIQYSANRYAFVSLTSWLVLASVGTVELLSQSKGRQLVLVGGVLLILILEPIGEVTLYYRYQNGNRDDWKTAFALVNQLKEPGDMVVVTNPRLGDYYTEGDNTIHYRALDYENLSSEEGKIWFIEDNNLGEKMPEILRWVEQNCEMIANFDVHVRARNFKMRVYLYDSAEP